LKSVYFYFSKQIYIVLLHAQNLKLDNNNNNNNNAIGGLGGRHKKITINGHHGLYGSTSCYISHWP